MKKTISTLFAILFFLCTSSLIECKMLVRADPRIWTVDDDGPADFHAIQEAINNPNVTLGDTIFVRRGIYYENVIINKTVSLIGEERDTTTVDALRIGSVFKVTEVRGVSIHNFTLVQSGLYPYDSGIRLERSSGNIISNIKMTDNTEGISLLYSNNNIISYNIISLNNNDGISFFLSSENVVSGNTISNNYAGIFVLYSDNNTIYHNNFINNTYSFIIQDSSNIWDDGVEGNFWSGYTGQDLNEDGIGDTSFKIENDKDNHPLMGTFSDFIVTLKGEVYHVAVVCNSTMADFRFKIGMETGNKIISFNTIWNDGSIGFCRITIPNKLMEYPYIILIDGNEAVPKLIDVSNETYACLYFTYPLQNQTITIISSEVQHLYNELLADYLKMQADLSALNTTYHVLLDDYLELKMDLSNLTSTYNDLLDNYLKLQIDLLVINVTYYALRNDFVTLQADLHGLNMTYLELLSNYSVLLSNYDGLRQSFDVLVASYEEHLFGYSGWMQNFQNLIYVFAATTAIFIMTTVYLSKHAHVSEQQKQKTFEDQNRG